MTNFERIKEMSVDELSEFIKATVEDCQKYCVFTKNGKCNSFGPDDRCAEGIKLYLQSENNP